MIRYPENPLRETVARELAPEVALERFLSAVRRVETSGGVWPRVERAFMPAGVSRWVQGRRIVGTGRAWNALVESRWAEWDLASAASYGPWQILYHTAADLGYSDAPWFLSDPRVCRFWAISLVARHVARGARTVEELADAWNSGSHRDSFVPTEYVSAVSLAYRDLAESSS